MFVRFKLSTWATCATLLMLAAGSIGPSQAQDFYKGRTVSLLIGFGPGGGFDAYARLLARHLGRFLPGNPTILPQNMPGGGGLTVTNYLYNVAPRDGTVIGMFGPFTGLEPLFGNANARFDVTKFTWIGNMDVDAGICVSWAASGIRTFDDTLKSDVPFGSSGQGSTTTQQVLFLRKVLGVRAKLTLGYQGSNEIRLAMRRGEVTATCGLYRSNAVTDLAQDLKSGEIKILVQLGRESLPEFGNAPNVYDLLTNNDEKQVADVIFRANESARPIAAPPGIPSDRAEELRRAFNQTLMDAAFLDDANRIGLPIHPTGSEQILHLFRAIYAAPPSIVDRAKSIMSGN
jgi:tripartite-type tricarboxylate transporter receptor subunit TctC